MPSLLLLSLLTALAQQAGSQPSGARWGGFRGDNGAGLSAETGLPAALDPGRNMKWRVAVPGGYSSPVVADGRVFLTGAIETAQEKKVSGKLVTLCLDAGTGATSWRHEIEFQGTVPGKNSCAAASPATDGEVVVMLFHHFGLLALDVAGKELWRQPMGPFLVPHGLSSSPVLADGLVVVQIDQNEGSYLAAFDRTTGAQRWRADRAGITHGYATPVVHRPADGAPQLVVSGALQLAGYSLGSGEKLWWFQGLSRQPKAVPLLAGGRCYVKASARPLSEVHRGGFSPVFAEVLKTRDDDGDQKLSWAEFGQSRMKEEWAETDLDEDGFVDASEWEVALTNPRGGIFAVELGGKGDVTETHLAWRLDDRRCLTGVTSPVIVGKTMFLLNDGGLLSSLDIDTGKVIKQERAAEPDQYFASPVGGDGKLYLASLSGLLSVVQAIPDWEVLATHALDDAEIWATPALAGKAVFVRSKESLCCFAGSE